jgi:putative transposase
MRPILAYFSGDPDHSLWSLNFFQVESICLKTHWVLVIMDQGSRKIIGFAVSPEPINSLRLAQLFTSCIGDLSPKRISHDHGPVFRSVAWKRVLAVLEIEEIWSVPFIPRSHSFVERLIGTIRRELLDRTLFWNERDLLKKLSAYQTYFNEVRVHSAIDGKTTDNRDSLTKITHEPWNLKWKSYCQGLFNVPVAA